MVKEIYDFDVALKGLIELVEVNLNKAISSNEANFEWLASYPAKAKQKISKEDFKMPKTPARKKTRQQKKRVFNEDDGKMTVPMSLPCSDSTHHSEQANGYHYENDVPTKKGKLSHEDDELQESLGGRPRRQASCVAKSKIQQSVKMANNLRQKMRRPNGEQCDADGNTSSVQDLTTSQDSDSKNPCIPMECGSPVLSKPKSKKENNNQSLSMKSEVSSPPISVNSTFSKGETKCPPPKVNFAPEPPSISPPPKISETFVVPEEQVEQEILSPIEPVSVMSAFVEAVPNDPPKKVRPVRKVAKKIELNSDDEKIVIPKANIGKQTTEDSLPSEESKEIKRQSSELKVISEPEVLPKKKIRKARTAAEEISAPAAVVVPSPRQTRNQRSSIRSSAVIVPNSPRVVKTPSKLYEQIQRNANNQFNPTNSSPVKRIFTPKLVFSPFKPTSVKTKVEAFEAALGSGGSGTPTTTNNSGKPMNSALPEARVLLQRLTSQQLKEAGGNAEKPKRSSRHPKDKEANTKRCTFVLENSDSEKENKSKRQSVAQILARKSVDKAKHIVTAARNKLLTNATHNETTESPNVHVNRNAATIMSKFRFTGASGSSGSSSALNRNVAMTQGKSTVNVVMGVGSFTGTKPVGTMPTKATEEDELKRKDLELKRLKEKEEEAARKREELMKAKAEEQKRKHEARAKRAMEQRNLRAKQLGAEQKQKLESKEEKSAHLKQKLQAESEEKAERLRAVLLQRQQEAEQRRKAEELQRQQDWEEEQLRLQALKKEQEEQEKQAKLKQAEAEKAKAAAAVAVPGPSTLNTTVTLPSSLTANYQITPVRVTKTGKLFNPDNYDIADMRSDDSTDDDSRPKKVIPSWARSVNLKVALAEQARGDIDTDSVFPAELLLKDPNLNDIFKIKRARFNKRTSSAVWKTPPSNYM